MQRIGEQEHKYVKEVLGSQFRASTANDMVNRLESKFAEVFQSKYAIAFTNGTATMHAALVAAGVGPGDEVIVPPLTMASTSFVVIQAGALPVFADIDPDSWTIDPASVRERITDKTKAIIPVSIYGLAPDFDELQKIAEQYGLFILEDDAQCFMGYYKGRIVGSIGDAASFSFQNSKHMTSGQGGMIITDDETLATKTRRFNSLGYAAVSAGKGKITKDMIQDPAYERHADIGWNYRMPALCAAVALGQLEKLPQIVDCRVKVAQLYAEAVAGCSWLTPQLVKDDIVHAYWTYSLKLSDKVDFSWHQFKKKYIEAGGDGFYGAWKLTYLEPVFRNKKIKDYQVQVFDEGLCPVAESIQPYLIQLKANYLDIDLAAKKAETLAETVKSFGG